ncbi:DNA repair protein RecO [Corynebacterium terpenotabidum]|uniref:DNA repair protein RecO n=1 Tax=Corynebacterium terpenotabidum Y-11 TaxID=1200352 RepID=S4XIR7_9CORY|nr:DNA repair protein RecO [Corynebacterium terpenotabidum]AGP30483.1 DNA repair protein RecO [Corynebacterium terpenotabidum Y-11]
MRPSYRDEAFVVRTHDLGEADQIIVLLTRHHGIVRGVAKGVRRTRSRFGARLDRFCLVDVLIYPGRNRAKIDGGLATLSDAATVHTRAPGIVADVDRFYAATAMLEIAELAVRGDGADASRIVDLLDDAFAAVGNSASDAVPAVPALPPRTQADRFVLTVLTLAGWAPSLVNCAQCGATGPHRAFHPEAGGAVCVRCRPPGAREPDPAAVRVLWWLAHGRDAQVAELAASPGGDRVLGTAHDLLLAHTRYQTESGCRAYAAL